MNKGNEETIHIHYTLKDQVTEITEKDAFFLLSTNPNPGSRFKVYILTRVSQGQHGLTS